MILLMRKTIFIYFPVAVLSVTLLFYFYVQATYASVTKLPFLKDGDLVFQTIESSQTLAIMFASGSLYTHVGIVKIDDDGQPNVIEAVGPVRKISLQEWIDQGVAGRLTVMRLKDAEEEVIRKALNRAEFYYGRPYDFFFLFDKAKIYCSELVYYAFKEGAGIEVGHIEKIGDLHVNNAAVRRLIRARWENYAPCKTAGVKSYDACFPIVMEQELVTPASVAEDLKLELVYSNY